MSGSADCIPSTPPDLLNKALQDAFEAGYIQGIKDALSQLQHLLNNTDHSTSVVAIVGRQQNWPVLTNQLISFNGKEMNLSPRFATAFSALLDARGEIISQRDMKELCGGKTALHTIISRLRKNLEETIPEIQIVTIGDGYRMEIRS
jgi:DNA-binding response OmpR family regulator